MPTLAVQSVEICPCCGSEIEQEPDSTNPCPVCGTTGSDDDYDDTEDEE